VIFLCGDAFSWSGDLYPEMAVLLVPWHQEQA